MLSAGIGKSHSLGGISFAENQTLQANAQLLRDVSVNVAYSGTLTTHTSNTAGTLTMIAGHNLTTGCRFDLYTPSVGVSYGCIAGTVATNSVPFTGASGVNVPAGATAIIACKVSSQEFALAGDNIVALLLAAPTQHGTFAFVASNEAAQYEKELSAGVAFAWYSGCGEANPLASDAVAKVYLSHDNIVSAQTMRVGALFN